MFCPMRSNWGDEERLELDISENHVTMHTNPGSTGCFAIEVPRTSEVIERRLQGKLEIRARSRKWLALIAQAGRYIWVSLLLIMPSSLANQNVHLIFK